jgi:hypothetical protein
MEYSRNAIHARSLYSPDAAAGESNFGEFSESILENRLDLSGYRRDFLDVRRNWWRRKVVEVERGSGYGLRV